MKKALFAVILASLFVGTTVAFSLAATDEDTPDAMQPAGASSAQMMDMDQMPYMTGPCAGHMMWERGMMGGGMGNMMGPGKRGMMEQQMAHMFYLDRAAELGLSDEQIGKLKALHSACRKDNIRTIADINIARLELADLIDGDDWSLQEAEPLVRKVVKLEGDLQMRHLQALLDARQVLTPEQLQRAKSIGNSEDLEQLFQ